MELERRYCMKFIREYFFIESIKVEIIINREDQKLEQAFDSSDNGMIGLIDDEYKIKYYFSDTGYPNEEYILPIIENNTTNGNCDNISGIEVINILREKGW